MAAICHHGEKKCSTQGLQIISPTFAGQKLNPGAFAQTMSPSFGGSGLAPLPFFLAAPFFPFPRPFFLPFPLAGFSAMVRSVSMHKAPSSPEEVRSADMPRLVPCSSQHKSICREERQKCIQDRPGISGAHNLTRLGQALQNQELHRIVCSLYSVVEMKTRQTIPSHLCSAQISPFPSSHTLPITAHQS